MYIWQAIVLGLVQGLTEFLPVSSTGHLELFKALFNIDIAGCELLFDIVLHMGTLIAVLVIYWKKIISFFKKPIMLLYLVIATIPAAVVGLIFNDMIEEHLLNGLVCGICFLVTAALLLVTEYVAKRNREKELIKPFGMKNAVCMGLAQAVAVLPGISRSGSTISAGVLSGADQEEVADFAFIMSAPVILGSFLLGIIDFFKEDTSATIAAFGSTSNMVWCLILGVIAAGVVGFLAIKLMVAAVKKANYKWFSLYLVLAAALSFVLFANGMFISNGI